MKYTHLAIAFQYEPTEFGLPPLTNVTRQEIY
jgi:hypothetical protein